VLLFGLNAAARWTGSVKNSKADFRRLRFRKLHCSSAMLSLRAARGLTAS
jgi:hypothetical protein